MRVLWLAMILVVPVLAGCASDNDETDEPAPAAGLDPDNVKVPQNARVNRTIEGLSLEFPDVSLPFSETITIPEGATMVRFVADPGAGNTISVSMSHAETGRRRCNQQPVVNLAETLTGARSCSSIAAIDPPGTEWTVFANGGGTADARVEFLSTPVDGVAARLDLSQLSHATYDLQPTEYLQVPSFDGTILWVEVTLPEGDGPWPTVIASSPYNGEKNAADRGNTPAMWRYWTQDYAKRGYAAVNVDVRGYGMSEGCVEVWGENEQRDQAYIVDWVAKQPWSDGNVGFYGQSYVGTTPVAAAVQAPDALKAIIAVAPVINAYDDWHYGGVPNGESSLSPVAYQVLTAAPDIPDPTQPTDLAAILAGAANGVCDPTLLPRANDPRATTNEFYDERNFKLRAGDVKAAVLFTEGFEDANVKSAMIPGWFNELQSPKLGVFGHWLHQHPARMDAEVLFLGWMDHYVKGRDLGFDDIPDVLVTAENDWHRTTDSWPSVEASDAEFGLDFAGGGLGDGSGSFDLTMLPVSADLPLADSVVLQTTLDAPLPLISPRLELSGTMNGENGFVYARLDETRADGSTRLVTWGMVNLALRNGYDSYEPAVGAIEASLPFRPTEFILEEGSTITLTIRGVQAGEALGLAQPQPAQFTIDGGTSALVIPTVPMDHYEPIPITARP